jgi:hypothetical protein
MRLPCCRIAADSDLHLGAKSLQMRIPAHPKLTAQTVPLQATVPLQLRLTPRTALLPWAAAAVTAMKALGCGPTRRERREADAGANK